MKTVKLSIISAEIRVRALSSQLKAFFSVFSSRNPLPFKMGRYAMEPDNASKSAKAKGSNLRVHFKVS